MFPYTRMDDTADFRFTRQTMQVAPFEQWLFRTFVDVINIVKIAIFSRNKSLKK